MIKIGTLCILLAPHEHAGRVCTVIAPPGMGSMYCADTGAEMGAVMAYPIDIPGIAPLPGARWLGARACDLRPLNDPDSGPRADVPRELVAA